MLQTQLILPYSGTTPYLWGQYISYAGSTYIVKQNTSAGQSPITQPTFYQKVFTSSTGGVTSVQLSGGIGISIGGTNPITTTGTISVTNTLPDRTVVLTNGTGISVTGTYPNFTITNTSPSSGGTVTTLSVVSANGFAGTVANATTTPAITLTTTITGVLKGNGTAISAATDADINGKLLTGYVSGAGTVASTDSILQGIQKLNGNITALVTGVSSVSGTTNRITSSPTTGTVIVDISASYVGQTSITTLGTVTTGTLSTGAVIAGVTMTLGSDATGDIYYRAAGGVLTRLAIGGANTVLHGGTVPSYSAIVNGDITTNTIAYSKIQQASTVTLLGNPTVGTANISEITLGAGLSFSGTTLVATGSGGTVTTVGFTGGLISVANPTTTPALTVAGTSGGVVYFSSTSTWASSGLLTASAIVLGGGAGAAPTSLALGTANQILGMNNGATAHEYKTVSVANTGTTFSTTNGANTLQINVPTVTGTNAGVLSTGADTIAGDKTFGGGSIMITKTAGSALSVGTSSFTFRTTNAGSNVVAQDMFDVDNSAATAGSQGFIFETTAGFGLTAANGTRRILRAAIKLVNLTNTAGSETGDIGIYTQSGGTAVAEKVRISSIGDVKLLTAGGGLYVKEGSNCTMGAGTLVAGTLVVSTTKVTANSRIFLTDTGGGVIGNIGSLYISARSAGTSFTVSSTNVLDTSQFNWILIEPS